MKVIIHNSGTCNVVDMPKPELSSVAYFSVTAEGDIVPHLIQGRAREYARALGKFRAVQEALATNY